MAANFHFLKTFSDIDLQRNQALKCTTILLLETDFSNSISFVTFVRQAVKNGVSLLALLRKKQIFRMFPLLCISEKNPSALTLQVSITQHWFIQFKSVGFFGFTCWISFAPVFSLIYC